LRQAPRDLCLARVEALAFQSWRVAVVLSHHSPQFAVSQRETTSIPASEAADALWRRRRFG
jgi:hypothetical protein